MEAGFFISAMEIGNIFDFRFNKYPPFSHSKFPNLNYGVAQNQSQHPITF